MVEGFFSDDQLERIARAGLSGLLLAGAQQVQREVMAMEQSRMRSLPRSRPHHIAYDYDDYDYDYDDYDYDYDDYVVAEPPRPRPRPKALPAPRPRLRRR